MRRDRHFFFFNYDGQRNEHAERGLPQRPRRHAHRCRDAGGDRAAAAAGESWEQKFESGRVPDQDRLAAHAGAPADAALQPPELQGRRTSSRAARRTRSSTPARRTSSRDRSTSRWRRSSGPRSSTRCASRSRATASRARPTARIPRRSSTRAATRVLTIGRNFFSPRETTIKRWQVADTLTWVRGRAQAEGRIRLSVRRHPQLLPRQLLGLLHVQHLASFQAAARPARASATSRRSRATARPARRRSPTSRSIRSSRRTSGGCGPTSRCNAGLRYDVQKFAQPPVRNPNAQLAAAGIDTSVLNTDTNNWGPRLGLAWSPAGARYVVRGGYGLFYGRTPSIMVGTAHSNNGINVQTLTFTGALVPTYPADRSPTLPTGVRAAEADDLHLRRRLPERAAAAGERRRSSTRSLREHLARRSPTCS